MVVIGCTRQYIEFSTALRILHSYPRAQSEMKLYTPLSGRLTKSRPIRGKLRAEYCINSLNGYTSGAPRRGLARIWTSAISKAAVRERFLRCRYGYFFLLNQVYCLHATSIDHGGHCSDRARSAPRPRQPPATTTSIHKT